MKRRRPFRKITSIENQIVDEAKRLREEAESLPPGDERDAKLREARLDETAFQWVTSPGLRPPS